MLSAKNTAKCCEVLDTFGAKHQLLKLIEELAELSAAASDVLQDWEYGLTENFEEELADVYVVWQHSQLMFNISDGDINDMADFKLDRALGGSAKHKKPDIEFPRDFYHDDVGVWRLKKEKVEALRRYEDER